MCAAGGAFAQTSVTYGRITAATLVTEQNRAAQTGGAILGGALGAASARNRSGGTAALRAGAGVFAGQQLGRVATQRQAFEYTILIDGTSTITMVTDEAGLRVGDCVAVERGAFNNLRLVDDARCAPRPTQAKAAPAAARAKATPAATRGGRVRAGEGAVAGGGDRRAFDRAYRRVRLLCQDSLTQSPARPRRSPPLPRDLGPYPRCAQGEDDGQARALARGDRFRRLADRMRRAAPEPGASRADAGATIPDMPDVRAWAGRPSAAMERDFELSFSRKRPPTSRAAPMASSAIHISRCPEAARTALSARDS